MTNDPLKGDSKVRYRALDTLRGVSALAIALGHFGAFYELSDAYYLAVDFFLVLSGFVLAHGYFADSEIALATFAWRRWARMYPLHLFSLLLVLGLNAVFALPTDWTEVVPHLLFVQNLGLGPDRLALNAPSWTISIEFWLNLVTYGFILALGGKLQRRTLVALACIGAICFSVTAANIGHLDTHTVDYKRVLNSGFIRCTASFCLGIIIYAVYQWRPPRPSLSAAEPVVFGLFVLALVFPWPRTVADFLAPVIFGFFVWLFAAENGVFTRFLARMGFLGDISFSLYLLHWPIGILVRETFPGLGPTRFESLAMGVVAVGLSACCYRWFELPIYRRLIHSRA